MTAEHIRLNEALEQKHPWKKWGAYYSNDFTVECPTGSGRQMNLYQVAEEIGRRLSNIFLRDKDGLRPVYGGTRKFQEDPHWRNCLSFYEYFHGDNGAGLGASHQTGRTGVIAPLLQMFASLTPDAVIPVSGEGIAEKLTQAKITQPSAV
jgi:hypothetical protein